MNTPDLHIEFESGAWGVRDALERVKGSLATYGLEPEEIGTVELVLAEAMNNIVEHAYPVADCPGPITVKCARQTNGLGFAIEDKGRAMPNGKTPVGMAVDVDVAPEDMPEGGFGWFLIKDLAKDVHYARIDDTNRLTFRISVSV
ncbi:MAG: ATP-binding protein [Pseudomonadota bacterium]